MPSAAAASTGNIFLALSKKAEDYLLINF